MNKILFMFAIVSVFLSLVAITSPISAHQIIWTEYSDTTSVNFITEQSQTPQPEIEKPCHASTKPEPEIYPETKFSDWVCVNNQLKRTNIIDGKEIIEYGGQCGIIEKPASKQSVSSTLILLPFTLFMLILILSVLTIIALLIR